MRPLAEQVNVVYQRLLANESDAPNDFIELLLDPLIKALSAQFPNLPNPDLISDVVIDALFKFVQSPESYQPARSNLWNYLYMDVLGDLRNAWAKELRHREREIRFDPVAHDLPDGNNDIEEEVIRRLGFSSIPEGMNAQVILTQLQTEIPNPHDWQVVLLMFSGEHRTSAFVAALDIEHLPIEIQRIRVKQTKDRLRLRLKRFGAKTHEH